jgi:phospholipase C
MLTTLLNSQRGHGGDPFTMKENTHWWMVSHAAALLEGEGEAGKQIHELVKPGQGKIGDAFHDPLCQGLYDADHKGRYNDAILPFGLVPTWKSHFYDPHTHTNWLGQTSPTAVTCGSKYYHLARSAYVQGDLHVAGYSLGLSLHYLTDLTQPMHTANFTWLHSWYGGYHTDFEDYAKSMLDHLSLPEKYVPLPLCRMPDGYLKAVARRTRDRYYQDVCRPEWTRSYRRRVVPNEVWHQRVGRYLAPMLGDAILITAEYLLAWMKSLQETHLEEEPRLTLTGTLGVKHHEKS